MDPGWKRAHRAQFGDRLQRLLQEPLRLLVSAHENPDVGLCCQALGYRSCPPPLAATRIPMATSMRESASSSLF